MESELSQQCLVQLHCSELSSKHFSSECTDLEIQGTVNKFTCRSFFFAELVSNKKVSSTGNSLTIKEKQ